MFTLLKYQYKHLVVKDPCHNSLFYEGYLTVGLIPGALPISQSTCSTVIPDPLKNKQAFVGHQ